MKNFLVLAALSFTMAGFAQCPTGGLEFTTQAEVDNFGAQYPWCGQIEGDVEISGNDITNLDALSQLTIINGTLEIRDASNLDNLDGLQHLANVNGDLILRNNDDLTSIAGLSMLSYVAGEFTIRSCGSLQSLDGLDALSGVGLALIIRDCDLIQDLDALNSLLTVGETLEIVDNAQLVSISGLSNLVFIEGGEEGAIVIEENDMLTTLEGLGSEITTISGGVMIASNTQLSYCSVPSICKYLANPPEGAVTEIGLNVTGCDSVAEVEAACGIMASKNFETGVLDLRVLQNPVTETLVIHSSLAGDGNIEIYDALSKVVLSAKMKNGLNYYAMNTAPGIYFVKMECEGKSSYTKIVKQ